MSLVMWIIAVRCRTSSLSLTMGEDWSSTIAWPDHLDRFSSTVAGGTPPRSGGGW